MVLTPSRYTASSLSFARKSVIIYENARAIMRAASCAAPTFRPRAHRFSSKRETAGSLLLSHCLSTTVCLLEVKKKWLQAMLCLYVVWLSDTPLKINTNYNIHWYNVFFSSYNPSPLPSSIKPQP